LLDPASFEDATGIDVALRAVELYGHLI
jgi:hypothetical protein